MKRLCCVAAGIAVLAAATTLPRVAGADDKPPSIKEIMTKAHKGGNALLGSIGKDLRSADTDWDDVQKKTKDLVRLGKALGKNEPPQGEQASWDKLTKAYVVNAEALDAAAQDKDKAKAQGGLRKLMGSCRSCHQVHKPS